METKTQRLFYRVCLSVGHKPDSQQETVYCQFNHSGFDCAGLAYIVAIPVDSGSPASRPGINQHKVA
jgi:hypothetical protein